jgi:hypothetical protein
VFSALAIWYSSRQLRLSSIVEILRRMEETRDDRHIVYAIGKKPYSSWSDPERKSADKVARVFDILGVLDSTHRIDRSFVDRFYSIPTVEVWDIVRPHVRHEQEKRGAHHLWEFEQLAKRLKEVKQNHPAYHNTDRWPLFPRRRRYSHNTVKRQPLSPDCQQE